jgi:hypothetical protein
LFLGCVNIHNFRSLYYVTLVSLLRHKLVFPPCCYYQLYEIEKVRVWGGIEWLPFIPSFVKIDPLVRS